MTKHKGNFQKKHGNKKSSGTTLRSRTSSDEIGEIPEEERELTAKVSPAHEAHRAREIPHKRTKGFSRDSKNSGGSSLTYKFSIAGVLGALVVLVGSFIYQGYLETRIYTPLGLDKMTDVINPSSVARFWGSYRPGVYFGMKHRSPKSLVTGLMWILPSQIKPNEPNLRHWCQQSDDLKRYGWIEHDGVNFGVQEIYDINMKITTSFVKREGGRHGGDWTSRIQVEPLVPSKSGKDISDEILLFYYVALEPGLEGELNPTFSRNKIQLLKGNTTELGNFEINFLNEGSTLDASHLITRIDSLIHISDVTLSNMISKRMNGKTILGFRENAPSKEASNLYVNQIHGKGSLIMEIVFESQSFFERPGRLAGESYADALSNHRKQFSTRVENTFHLAQKGYNSTAIGFAQAALSNLIGGIGHFYGTSKVQSVHTASPVSYWPASLYTAVPSRSFFPRGFLWDEGFHLLLINRWNPEISLDIISHWLDLMNVEGWIPREQMLGDEAQSRVPEEFVVQRNNVANPPTLIIAIADLLDHHEQWLILNHKESLYRMWPRLATWYNWLNKTQIGEVPTSYRWRGRNSTTERELNPKTLASGLDDYPRASHPSNSERHLDLRCWMAVISKLMSNLSEILLYDGRKYEATYKSLTDVGLLDKLHWSEELKAYTDYGLHSQYVKLKYRPVENGRQKNTPPHLIPREMFRQTKSPPTQSFVNMFGYVNLFPMIANILPSDSEKLKLTIEHLADPKHLWTPYGLRSLSAKSPLYNEKNTEHDPPYWRGPIWININFLALKALKSYSSGSGPGSTLALVTHNKLKKAVTENVMREYWRTGYIWEQYNDLNGEGKGCRPFTGWSSLVVLIMSEEY